MATVQWEALSVFLLCALLVCGIGFGASRWQPTDLGQLQEWGLAGRRFGTLITWFLVGGDLYTATTFIAIPALAYGAGAQAFFALPYFLLVYPLMLCLFPSIWRIAAKEGCITPADLVRGRFMSRPLTMAIAATGIIATMPYLAMQIVGMQVVLGGLGLMGKGLLGEAPLVLAFVVLSLFTYSGGLRAPAALAILKDLLIYVTVFAAVLIIPIKLGGLPKIFAAVPAQKLLLPVPPPGSTGSYSAYATLAVGSALAILLYPHSMTSILSAKSEHTVRRNAALLPAFSLLLPLLVLIGYMAIAAGVDKIPAYSDGFRAFKANFVVPALMLQQFPSWFVGVAFAAIGIGALVPAAVMSIAAANLFARNIYGDLWPQHATGARQTQVARWTSLFVKFGALLFVLYVPSSFAIQLQLLGGIWILQTLPTLVLGLFTRFLRAPALLLGWAVGMCVGTGMAVSSHFSAIYPLAIGKYTVPAYGGVYALLANLLVASVVSLLLRNRPQDRPTEAALSASASQQERPNP